MRLYLMRHQVILIKRNRARIVVEYRNTKVLFSLPLSDQFCRTFYIPFVNSFLHFVERVIEYRMLAVFGPRTRDRFELDIGWPALFPRKISSNSSQFFERKRKGAASTVRSENPLFANSSEFLIIYVEIHLYPLARLAKDYP